ARKGGVRQLYVDETVGRRSGRRLGRRASMPRAVVRRRGAGEAPLSPRQRVVRSQSADRLHHEGGRRRDPHAANLAATGAREGCPLFDPGTVLTYLVPP